MFSRCPHCDSQQALSVGQLRQQRGLLVCAACGERFDGLQFLCEDKETESTTESGGGYLAQTSRQPRTPAVWMVASAAMLLVLIAQVIYFQGYGLSMQPRIRAGLQLICAVAGCRLPDYKNLDELAISHGDLQLQADNSYLFTAAITNQAPLPQANPALKLTLLGFGGQTLAERVFSLTEYAGVSNLAADQTAPVRLQLVAPPAKVGGYAFTLL